MHAASTTAGTRDRYARPVLAPTPLLKPGPLDVGGLFAGAFAALKRRFGLFVLITLLPLIVGCVVVAGGVAILVPPILAAASGHVRSLPGGLLAGLLVLVVGGIVTALVQVKSYGMLAVAAYEVAQGGRPGLRGVLDRSSGFLPRMAPVIGIAIVAVLAVYAGFTALFLSAMSAAGSRGNGSFAAVFGLMILLALAAIPLAVFFGTRLLYTIPAVALEQRGGFDAMKRSWNLTGGSFWRTFGSYFLASLAVSAASYLVGMVGQVLVLPFGAGLSGISDYHRSDPRAALAVLGAMVPMIMVLFGLQLVVQLAAVPFREAYTTYMFIDQVRRSELPPAPAYGYGPPQFYSPPGHPPQGYPPSGYPQGQWPPRQG